MDGPFNQDIGTVADGMGIDSFFFFAEEPMVGVETVDCIPSFEVVGISVGLQHPSLSGLLSLPDFIHLIPPTHPAASTPFPYGTHAAFLPLCHSLLLRC